MAQTSTIRTGRHCVFVLHAHLVFVTKYRRDVFNAAHLDALRAIFERVCADFGATVLDFNGEDDHVHLLVNYPPKVALSGLVNSLKGVSSRIMRRNHPELASRFWRGHLWSPSYFAGSVGGAPIGVLRDYIRNQQTPAGPNGPDAYPSPT